MRLVVLFVVLLACQVFCQNELKNGACKLESAPSEGSYIKLKLKENTQNKQSAKFTFKGDTEEIIDLNLSNLGQDEFFLHVEVENLKYDCEIDEVGVTFEELTDKNDLKNGACKLKSAPALGSTLYLKLKQNTNNVDAKITLKGKDGKTDQKVNLKLKDSVQNEFEVPITVENLSDGCEIDDAGVTLEELLAQKVGLNSEFTLVGPATQAELTFQATSEKPLFVRTEFVGTGSTDLRVKTANPLALDISVRGQDNLLHVQGTDLTKDANIKITIKRLKATEKLIFQTTDTFDITTLSGKTLHYVCSRDGCEFTFDQKTVLTHLTVEKGATHTVNKGKPSEYKVTGGLKYIKTLKKNSDVFERGQIFITLKPQAVALAVFIENETRVEGPVEANELELKYSQPLLLLTSGTDSTSLEVTTGTRNTLNITLERERSNLLQASKNNNKKIKIKDLKEKESLTFKILNRSNYQLPMDTTLHYACTDACFLPSQNKERLMLFTVLQRWPEVAVNEGIENKEVKVNQDTSYIKLSRGKEKFGKGQILMNFASKSDAFDLKTKNLVFEGKEASGFWRLPKEKRAFDLKVTEQTNLTFSVNNKLALKETDMLKTVSFSPSRKEFFYISKQEAQSRFSFRIKANKETKVEIMDSQNLPTEVSLEPGTSNILDETKVGFINRPKDQKQIELNVHSSPQSAIKVDSRLFDLSDFFSTRLRVEDFGNRDYIWLKVFGSKDIHVDRIDKNAAYRIQERENKLSASQEIDIPYSINGYTLYINNSLKNSGVVDLKFEENPKMPRKLEKSSTKRVFLYEEDYGRKEFIRAKVLLEQGKEVIVKGSKRIETFQLENRDYYVKKNKAFFQPENAEYDYYFKFRLNDSTDSLAIDFLNKRFLLKDTESFKTIKVLKNEHKGQPIEVSFTSQKPSKEVHVTVAIQVAPCSKNTCENDGKCVDGQDDNYTCECKDGYEGERCEIKKENEEDKNSSPRSKAAVWMIVGVASFFFLMN